jgi:hypothetical protein
VFQKVVVRVIKGCHKPNKINDLAMPRRAGEVSSRPLAKVE